MKRPTPIAILVATTATPRGTTIAADPLSASLRKRPRSRNSRPTHLQITFTLSEKYRSSGRRPSSSGRSSAGHRRARQRRCTTGTAWLPRRDPTPTSVPWPGGGPTPPPIPMAVEEVKAPAQSWEILPLLVRSLRQFLASVLTPGQYHRPTCP